MLLAGPLRLGGIALAGSVSAVSNFLLLFFILFKRVGPFLDRSSGIVFCKSLLASSGMGLGLFFAKRFFSDIMAKSRVYNAGLTLLLLLFGILVYLILNLVLKNRDIMELVRIFMKRMGLSKR